MKKIFAMFLALMTVVSLCLPVAAEEETVTIGGKIYHMISTAEQFEKINGGQNYVLTQDIDFGGKVYDHYVVPAHFYGILDGNGHSIFNFSIDSATDKAGIFNMTYDTDADGVVKVRDQVDENDVPILDPETGDPLTEVVVATGFTYTIRNLTVGSETAPVSIKGTTQVGTLSGYIHDGNVFDLLNVNVYANVESTGQQAGGFIGRTMPNRQLMPSAFSNCHFYGSVSAGGANVGGFIGRSANPITFTNCENHGEINANTFTNVGGFVGCTHAAKYAGLTFTRCTNSGKVMGVNCVGGFTGKTMFSVTLDGCVNNGEIAALGTHVGGLVAYFYNEADYLVGVTATLTNCTNNGKVWTDASVSGKTCMGGLVGTVLDNLVIMNCVNNGEVAVEADTLTSSCYVGGVLGLFSPQVTDANYKRGEHFTAQFTTAVNNGDILYDTGASASVGGIVGGTTWEGTYCTILLDRCTNTGDITNFCSMGASSRVAGIIGRFEKETGILKITNCLNKGSITGTANDTVGGILGYTNAEVNCEDDATAELEEGVLPIVRSISNCLNMGVLLKGTSVEGTYGIGRNYVLSGTATNCYTISAVSDDEMAEGADFKEYILTFGQSSVGVVTMEQLQSGEVACLLGEAFGQTLGVDTEPAVGGNTVLMNTDGILYNKIHTHDFADNAYQKLNAGSHVRLCNICGEKITEAHIYDGFVDLENGSHGKVCKLCGHEGTVQNHSCETYEDNGNGTHSGECSSCGTAVTAEHTFDKGKCADCGVSQPVTSTETDADTADTQSTPIKLKLKGCRSYVSLSGYALVGVIAVALSVKRRNGEEDET